MVVVIAGWCGVIAGFWRLSWMVTGMRVVYPSDQVIGISLDWWSATSVPCPVLLSLMVRWTILDRSARVSLRMGHGIFVGTKYSEARLGRQ